jgi:hypothetical protein
MLGFVQVENDNAREEPSMGCSMGLENDYSGESPIIPHRNGLLLVPRRVYSQWLVSYWLNAGYVLGGWSPIGRTHGMFSVAGHNLLLRRPKPLLAITLCFRRKVLAH